MLYYCRSIHRLIVTVDTPVFGNTCLECVEQIQALQKNLYDQLHAIHDQTNDGTFGQWIERITVRTEEIKFEKVAGYIYGKAYCKVEMYAPRNIRFEEDSYYPSTEQVVDPLEVFKEILPCITELQNHNQNTQNQFIETVGEKNSFVKEQLIMSFNKTFEISQYIGD